MGRKGGPGAKPGVRQPTSREMDTRMALLETALVHGMTPRAVEQHFSMKWGISDRMVREYVRRVRAKWADAAREEGDAFPEQREARRNAIRQRLEQLYQDAAMRIGPTGVREPNITDAVRVARLLMDLDGLEVPDIQIVQHMGTVNLDPLSERSAEDKRHFLMTGQWPDRG